MKKMIASFIAGALIFGSVGVYAAGGNMIEVFYNINDIKIDKVSKMPEQKPFVYNGTTYVPLRYISENLGKAVAWDSKAKTIHIGERTEATAVYPGNGIEYMGYQEDDSWNKLFYNYGTEKAVTEYGATKTKKIRDNIGNEYDKFVALYLYNYSNNWNYVEFPLNGQYKIFKSKIGLTEEFKNTTTTGKVEILADDVVVKTLNFEAGSFPEDVEIDITGVNKITFKLSTENKAYTEVGFFDARFLK